ncbi:NEDD4 family-interacting protein 1 [Uranotaenia lowii]|uniref:NEDD4 family-interacting protein 1 n=1 Tax=Uranotaenia lowii TaxID=190385 RepID=UPI002479386F|nr:NEDD4 family-interacting protein 1 [Uranotaenia lowii]
MPPANNNNDDLPPPKADFSAPPPYEVTDNNGNAHQYDPPEMTTKLPTYEEVQMEKMINHELPIPPGTGGHGLGPPPPPSITRLPLGPGSGHGVGSGGGPAVTFIAIDADGENINADNSLLGTDIVFVTAFLVAFLFNWIGFLMLTCFCHTIAARYGALSGFGLSLAKWTLIVKHSTDFASHENSWLWWLIMAFGFLICVRALVQYISIKRTWRLLSTSAQERLLFFY